MDRNSKIGGVIKHLLNGSERGERYTSTRTLLPWKSFLQVQWQSSSAKARYECWEEHHRWLLSPGQAACSTPRHSSLPVECGAAQFESSCYLLRRFRPTQEPVSPHIEMFKHKSKKNQIQSYLKNRIQNIFGKQTEITPL